MKNKVVLLFILFTTSVMAQKTEIATFGGGCFWCTEAVFQQLRGVEKVESGYSGGHVKNPIYWDVTTGRTGHAEVIQITFNPDVIPFADLVRVFMATHNPTTLNQQGADKGTQYRSIILYHSTEQLATAKEIIKESQKDYSKPIVTELKAFEVFYKAEESHQDYYDNNSNNSYCTIVINPKLEKLRAKYADKLK